MVTNDRIGFFAYVYRRVTAQMQKEIQLQRFEDNERMESFDVAFANLYLDAYYGYKAHEPISKSWEFAFQNKHQPLTILQHIMIGMNTHINLDLGTATSTAMKDKEIRAIENDFNKVNDVLASIVNELQDRLGHVSPLLFLLDIIGQNTDEKIINFSMKKARNLSWQNANVLWSLDEHNQNDAIEKMDVVVLSLGEIIKAPKSKIISFILRLIGYFEEKNVGKIITRLRED